ncbi:MAG: enoyl-CoA hydratase family protein [Gammaproteobacteria bacterium]|nr:enoyl-CoA hydratase family protein [Gammaproteobacteria bacterium]MCY4211655.1 enoyl-CoA hydratase family protein [Gammaproteobacteria bacterium]MCY4281915.1 enoyl-CoA hydratase family protein [Gammaproteobacteria bacterium]MCY4338934.1 enoyl-CoA hydratase family protein [Gammaproteobacteria bacterium]
MNMQNYNPQHFAWSCADGLATVTLNRPERKNPLTFASYAELRDTFRLLASAEDVKVVIITGAEGNFCSGGDVRDIIGPLMQMNMKGLLEFTRMTGALIKAMIHCPQPIIAAVDGICVGAGACIAMASDLRIATPQATTAFLFSRVGLAGCDMGACAILPRIIGHGRAAELLYTGRSMSAEEGHRWGFYNHLITADQLQNEARRSGEQLLRGPTFAQGVTKTMLRQEWDMALDQALEAEAQAQALCMQTDDFGRAYTAFINKEKPEFKGD